MSEGKKFDGGKPRFDLIPLHALTGAATVMGFGAEKYGAWNWLAVDKGEERYLAALLRHIAMHQAGELIDPESGQKHIDHALCNMMFLAALNKDK
jgi:hypothetical protein